MPLVQGSSDAAIQENIRRLIKEGKPKDQAVAIAYSIAEQNKKKRKKRQR